VDMLSDLIPERRYDSVALAKEDAFYIYRWTGSDDRGDESVATTSHRKNSERNCVVQITKHFSFVTLFICYWESSES
jgi:hypothetical protein